MKDKKYKSISEVSELLKINKHVIRYWDTKFDGISQCGQTPGVISGLIFKRVLLKNWLILGLTIFFISTQILSTILSS